MINHLKIKSAQCVSTWFIVFFMSRETRCSLLPSCCYGSHYGFRCGMESHPIISSVLPLPGGNSWQPLRQYVCVTCSRKDCHSFWCEFTFQVIWNQFDPEVYFGKTITFALLITYNYFFSSYPVELFTFFKVSILLMGYMHATAFQHVFIPFHYVKAYFIYTWKLSFI